MASAYVESYVTAKNGLKRYRVRARAGRSSAPLLHLGSFETRKLAEKRKQWAEDLMAKGIRPSLDLLFPGDPTPMLTVEQAVDRYLEQRPDLAERSRRTYRALTPHITKPLGARDVHAITPDDVRELIRTTSSSVGPDATRSIRGILAGALDHCGVKPNPARDPSVKLPRRTITRMDAPPAEHLRAIYQRIPADLLLPMQLLEATGARISELLGVTYADVDHAASKVRLVGKGGKPRIIPLPLELAALMPRVSASQRLTKGKVWPGLSPDRIRKAMTKACDDAKITRYAPHSMRRRFASRHVQIGTPINQTSELLGHARTSLTLDVYAKVLMDGDTAEVWREFIHD